MPSRAKRALIVLTILGGCFLYLKGATHFEQQTIAAQVPPVAAGQAVARHVDRTQWMNDVRTLGDPALEGRRTGEPGGLKARAWVEAQFGAKPGESDAWATSTPGGPSHFDAFMEWLSQERIAGRYPQ